MKLPPQVLHHPGPQDSAGSPGARTVEIPFSSSAAALDAAEKKANWPTAMAMKTTLVIYHCNVQKHWIYEQFMINMDEYLKKDLDIS